MFKLETRAKFHYWIAHQLEMIIALNSPIREDQNRPKDHQIWTRRNMFLNLCPYMGKLSRSATSSCRLTKPNRHVTSPSTTCINISDLSPHLESSSLTHPSLYFSHWFVYLLGIPFSLTRMARRMNFRKNHRVENFRFSCSLTSVDSEFLGRF